MREPIHDPYPVAPQRPVVGGRGMLGVALVLASVAALGAGVIAVRDRLLVPPASTSVVTVRPTPAVLVAIKDLARLETAQVQVEKVVDLKDTQSSLFGLIESEDALLLVAVGRATIGIDLADLGENDVTFDETSRVATLRLPRPRVLDAALDEDATYVYRRDTSLLAKRNEQLEGQARRAAVRAIEQAADTPEVKRRAEASAERQLGALCRALGASGVDIVWR